MFYPELTHELGAERQALFAKLTTQLESKRPRNRLRSAYYEQRNSFKDLNLTLPPTLKNRIEASSGWVAKGVDALADRIMFNGFALPGGDVDSWGITEIWEQNRLDLVEPMATRGSLIHGVSFLVTYLGNPAVGQPKVVVDVHSALQGTALMSSFSAGVDAYLGVMGHDEIGAESYFVMLTRTEAVHIWRMKSDEPWQVLIQEHGLGIVPVEPLPYRPTQSKVFGQSRISRSAMAIADSAIRTSVRIEVHAEAYVNPQRWLSGVDLSQLGDTPAFRALSGAIWAVPALERDNSDGNPEPHLLPEFGQFPMAPITPHLEVYNALKADIAAEMSLPPSSYGLHTDNPASAEAIYAAKEDLVVLAERTTRTFGHAWARTMSTAVQLRDGLSTRPEELASLQALYRNPSTPSQAASADFTMKVIASGALSSDSPVVLELLGLTPAQVERELAHRARANNRATLNALLAEPEPQPTSQPAAVVPPKPSNNPSGF